MAEKPSAESSFAIVRVDKFQLVDGQLPSDDQWPIVVTVKGLVHSEAEAIGETNRLNSLNGSKGCIYFWQVARCIESHVKGNGRA